MKIALAQQNYTIGNIAGNKALVLSAIEQAKALNAELVVFPELTICGYPPLDLLTYSSFVKQCGQAIADIAKYCVNITAIVGGPSFNKNENGKRLYNSAFVLQNGRQAAEIHKALLPTYDIFDEYRYFEPAHTCDAVNIAGQIIALTICEDLWAETGNRFYQSFPMAQLSKQKPDLIINIAASPFYYNQAEDRYRVLSTNARKYNLPLIYVNHVGAQTDLIFDGGSLYMDTSGKVIQQLPYFKESLMVVDTDETDNSISQITETNISLIHDALVMGIRDYFSKMGFKKAVLGLSGGIDSAVVAILAKEALGEDNMMGVLLPSQFSSDHSVSDTLILAKTLGIQHQIIPIAEIYQSHKQMLEPLFKDLPFGLAEENLQARIRGTLLMAISNKFGHILLNTTNKSEMAVGYGTLYGDMCGGLSVLGDVYKTQIYELASYMNRIKVIIPESIINKVPSAELRPDQKDSDSLPEYEILDKILYHYIEDALSAGEIIEKGYEEALVERVLKLVNMNEYKRFQAAPVLRISPKAFGRGRVMPLVGKY